MLLTFLFSCCTEREKCIKFHLILFHIPLAFAAHQRKRRISISNSGSEEVNFEQFEFDFFFFLDCNLVMTFSCHWSITKPLSRFR